MMKSVMWESYDNSGALRANPEPALFSRNDVVDALLNYAPRGWRVVPNKDVFATAWFYPSRKVAENNLSCQEHFAIDRFVPCAILGELQQHSEMLGLSYHDDIVAFSLDNPTLDQLSAIARMLPAIGGIPDAAVTLTGFIAHASGELLRITLHVLAIGSAGQLAYSFQDYTPQPGSLYDWESRAIIW